MDVQKTNNPRLSTIDQRRPCDLAVFTGMSEPLAPGEKVGRGPLIRDYNVIRYCVYGSVKLIVNGKEFDASAGQCYAIFEGDVVTEVNTSDKICHLSAVSIFGTKAKGYLEGLGVSSEAPFFPWSENYEVLKMMKEIERDIGSFSLKTELLRCEAAYRLLNKLKNCVMKTKEDECIEDAKGGYIVKALQYMEENFANKITVSDVAAHVGINRSYFYSLFKSETGLPPQEHLIRLKISKACDLFAHPRSTAVSVANAVGIDESLFFRHFKRICGKTPAEYKEMLMSQNK